MVYQIKQIEYSKKKNKKYKVIVVNNNKEEIFDFGDKNGQTFLEHKDEQKRINYFKRHYNNNNEKKIIDNLIMSPSLLSLFILWGPYSNIISNVNYLNKILKKYNKFDPDMILTKKYI